ncbi:MAG: hypothetical protein WAM91_13280 [Candidatus Acidiferrales bacterium]
MTVRKRSIIWATVMAVGPLVAFLILGWVSGLLYRYSTIPDKIMEHGGVAVIGILVAPGLAVSFLLALAFSPTGVHGINGYFLSPAPFVNWAFYYYCVFRPFFRWRARRRAAQGGAGRRVKLRRSEGSSPCCKSCDT